MRPFLVVLAAAVEPECQKGGNQQTGRARGAGRSAPPSPFVDGWMQSSQVCLFENASARPSKKKGTPAPYPPSAISSSDMVNTSHA